MIKSSSLIQTVKLALGTFGLLLMAALGMASALALRTP